MFPLFNSFIQQRKFRTAGSLKQRLKVAGIEPRTSRLRANSADPNSSSHDVLFVSFHTTLHFHSFNFFQVMAKATAPPKTRTAPTTTTTPPPTPPPPKTRTTTPTTSTAKRSFKQKLNPVSLEFDQLHFLTREGKTETLADI